METQKSERGGLRRAFGIVLVVLTILGLGTLVAYLMIDINKRKYRIVAQSGRLIVEKGKNMPFGFEPFTSDVGALRSAYAPLMMPPGEKLGEPEVFADRADVDRALFSLLAGWARRGLESEDLDALSRATNYVERCDLLPGLSEEQRNELDVLRADLAYKNGRAMVQEAIDTLNNALDEFDKSIRLGTSRPTDAAQWMQEIKRRIAALGGAPTPAPPEGAKPPGTKSPKLPDLTPPPAGRSEPEPSESERPPSKWRL